MSESKSFDRHGRAATNASRLASWRAETTLQQVPLNQFGSSSKETICKMLGISRSTAHTNPQMKAIFEEMDAELAKLPRRNKPEGRPENASTQEPTIADMNDALAEMRNENNILIRKLRIFAYLEDTGLDVRP